MQHSTPTSTYTSVERTRDRCTQRTTSVFEELSGISSTWLGLRTLVKVEHTGTRRGKPYQHTAYYISSLRAQATVFAQGIRGHWRIENCLHWVKDVVFQEDCSAITQGNAPANFSIIRSFVVNLLRNNGYQSLTTAMRLLANDLEKLCALLE